MQLSEHFSLEELCYSDTAIRNGIDNLAPVHLHGNLSRLCAMLEEVRKVLGKPIHINSGYRSPNLNSLVRGQPSSQHLTGCAADIRIDGMKPDEVVRAIIASNIQFDQLIREFDSWTHISVPNQEGSTPRGQTLIIDHAGTRPFA